MGEGAHAECRRVLLGALADVVRGVLAADVGLEMRPTDGGGMDPEAGSRGEREGDKRTGREREGAESSLREGVRRWIHGE